MMALLHPRCLLHKVSISHVGCVVIPQAAETEQRLDLREINQKPNPKQSPYDASLLQIYKPTTVTL